MEESRSCSRGRVDLLRRVSYAHPVARASKAACKAAAHRVVCFCRAEMGKVSRRREHVRACAAHGQGWPYAMRVKKVTVMAVVHAPILQVLAFLLEWPCVRFALIVCACFSSACPWCAWCWASAPLPCDRPVLEPPLCVPYCKPHAIFFGAPVVANLHQASARRRRAVGAHAPWSVSPLVLPGHSAAPAAAARRLAPGAAPVLWAPGAQRRSPGQRLPGRHAAVHPLLAAGAAVWQRPAQAPV
jgi:hypothetical protein